MSSKQIELSGVNRQNRFGNPTPDDFGPSGMEANLRLAGPKKRQKRDKNRQKETKKRHEETKTVTDSNSCRSAAGGMLRCLVFLWRRAVDTALPIVLQPVARCTVGNFVTPRG